MTERMLLILFLVGIVLVSPAIEGLYFLSSLFRNDRSMDYRKIIPETGPWRRV